MSAYAISGRGVRALKELVRGPANVGAPGFSPAAVSPDALPPVYTVRWAQSENNGDGAWIIYLANGQYDLYDGPQNPVPVGGDLMAAANYPAGWYVLPDTESGLVMLNLRFDWISASKSWYLASAKINGDWEDDDLEGTYETSSIVLAYVSRDGETGQTTVTQLVVGALVLPPPFGCDEEEGPYDPPQVDANSNSAKPWDIVDNDLVRRYFNVGGITYLWANGAAANVSQRVGYICLKIGAYGGNPLDSAEIVTAADMGALAAMQRDEGYYIIPLWHRSQNGDLVDMRVTPQLQLVEAAL